MRKLLFLFVIIAGASCAPNDDSDIKPTGEIQMTDGYNDGYDDGWDDGYD
ncbi:MAG: hypothetical protein RIC35_08595 [Marinoscillum sp.]